MASPLMVGYTGHLRVAVSLCAVVLTLYGPPPMISTIGWWLTCSNTRVTSMKERHLKIREGRRDYQLKSQPNSGNPKIPFLLLKGAWLENAGFTINMPVTVKIDKNCLLISPKKE